MVTGWPVVGLIAVASVLGLPEDIWYPELAVVLEGQARSVPDAAAPVRTVRADGSGDDAVVSLTRQLLAEGRTVTVATSDRGLAERSRTAGAAVLGAGRMRELLGY